MTQQDYTAPVMAVKASRNERFQQTFEVMLADGTTPDTSLKTRTFFGVLFDLTGVRVGLGTCEHPADNAVLVTLNTTLMAALKPGRYQLEVYSVLAQERENLITVLMTVE